LTKIPLICRVSYFNLGGWSCVWGAKPTKAPRGGRLDWIREESHQFSFCNYDDTEDSRLVALVMRPT